MPGTETRLSNTFVRALNRTERQLLMLFYAEELTTAEIGVVLDLAETQVRNMLESLQQRARAVLSDQRAAAV
jgi:RNA polymerase sigma factor for flagellar operon FliA